MRVLLPLVLAALLVTAATASRAEPETEQAAKTAKLERAAKAALSKLLATRGPAAGTYGVHVVDGDTGAVIFDRAGSSPRLPASTMKVVTSAAAVLELGWDHVFATRVLAGGRPDRAGTLAGDLVVAGGGDPTLVGPGVEGRGLDDLARELARNGVRRVDGNVVLDDGRFDRQLRQDGWPRDQWMHWYCAPVTALTVNRSCVTVRVEPAAEAGKPARVELVPPLRSPTVRGEITTTAKQSEHKIVVDLRPGATVLTVRGKVWIRSSGYEVEIALPDPTVSFGELFARALVRAGISVRGEVVTERGAARDREGLVELARVETPLFEVLKICNQRSQNLFAECVLKTIGFERTGEGSFAAGGAVTGGLPESLGLGAAHLVQVDGSGLSRQNRASPKFLARLLAHIYGTAPAPARYLQTLAAGGDPEGSLRKRLNELGGEVRAKTGTIRGVSALAGFVRTKTGRVLCFAVLVNDPAMPVARSRQLQDEICRILHEGL